MPTPDVLTPTERDLIMNFNRNLSRVVVDGFDAGEMADVELARMFGFVISSMVSGLVTVCWDDGMPVELIRKAIDRSVEETLAQLRKRDADA